MKIFFGAKRRMFMTKGGVAVSSKGYIVEYIINVRLYGLNILNSFVGIIREDKKKEQLCQ